MQIKLHTIGILRKELPIASVKPHEFPTSSRLNSRASRRPFWPGICLLGGLALSVLTGPGAEASENPQSIDACLAGLGAKAVAQGVPAATVEASLAGIQPLPRVLELESRQPEFTLSFGRYMERLVTEDRVTQGRALLKKHGDLLREIGARYGVQPRFLVAFWGLETNFGGNLGSFRTLDALATLACQGRRRDFFSDQLVDALEIVGRGEAAAETMIGSWAGALGQVQFIPSTFQAYAVDHDGDGRRDLWGNLGDAFASAANFLSALGWTDQQTWGREVRLPENFDWRLLSIETKPETVKDLSEWAKLGVRKADGSPLPRVKIEGAVIAPAGHRGPAFMVYGNYRRILDWNRSILYALAVGHLSDRLVGKPSLSHSVDPQLGRLSLAEVQEIQRRLNGFGFELGTPDGRVGPLTRGAIRRFQLGRGLPADGFADKSLLIALRQGGSG